MRIRLASGSIGAMAWLSALVGCMDQQACAPFDMPDEGVWQSSTSVYMGSGDPYQPGELSIVTIDVARCDQAAPVSLRVYAPESPGEYAVIVFQHGFMSRNDAYDEILRHLASHGFVVVAPQMYEPGIGPLLGNPTSATEADLAALLVQWLPAHLTDVAGVQARTDRLGIAGHSRGGKVAWLAADNDSRPFDAIAGVDPVDGAGGPLGGQDRVVQGPFAFNLPSLVIGAELGGDCAPAGDNHEQFYEASPSPSWHIITIGHGHGDMLDEPEAAAASALCPSGPDREGMRRLTAGLLAAFFRSALQDDPGGYGQLSAPPTDGVAIVFESK